MSTTFLKYIFIFLFFIYNIELQFARMPKTGCFMPAYGADGRRERLFMSKTVAAATIST